MSGGPDLSWIPALFPQALKNHDATLEVLSFLKGFLYRLTHRHRPDYCSASFEFRPLVVRDFLWNRKNHAGDHASFEFHPLVVRHFLLVVCDFLCNRKRLVGYHDRLYAFDIHPQTLEERRETRIGGKALVVVRALRTDLSECSRSTLLLK